MYQSRSWDWPIACEWGSQVREEKANSGHDPNRSRSLTTKKSIFSPQSFLMIDDGFNLSHRDKRGQGWAKPSNWWAPQEWAIKSSVWPFGTHHIIRSTISSKYLHLSSSYIHFQLYSHLPVTNTHRFYISSSITSSHSVKMQNHTCAHLLFLITLLIVVHNTSAGSQKCSSLYMPSADDRLSGTFWWSPYALTLNVRPTLSWQDLNLPIWRYWYRM